MTSLPPSKKDVTAKPGKDAVTEPINVREMNADVDRKMRLYGVIQAFREGRLPDNQQIDETLVYVGQHSPVNIDKLTPEGKKLISDTRDIIETARLIVREKNADELFQNFVYHTSGADVSRGKQSGDVLPTSKSELRKDGEQAIQHLRTLMTLILTNSEARKLLSDVGLIGRDLFARGASHVANLARPDEERLRHVDDAAPSDKFIGEGGKVHGTDEKPNLELGIGDTRVVHDPDQPGLGTTLKRGDQEKDAGEAYNEGRDQYDQAKEGVKNTAVDNANQVAGDVDQNATTDDKGEKADIAKKSVKDKLFGLKDRIPEEHRQKVGDIYNENLGKTKQFLKDEFPEERRDQFIYRLKKVIVECQKHEDYQQALTWFLSQFETYLGHGKSLANTGTNSAGAVSDDPSLQRAWNELRTFLERFANGQSLDGIINAVQNLSNDAKNDEGLRNWFKELDEYVRKTLMEPGYVLSPNCNTRANELRDSGHKFFDEKYKGHKDTLFDEVQKWFSAWGTDPLNNRFGEDWKRLTRDLLFDDEGNLTFKPQLWGDIRKVILPGLIERVGYVPIPRVEYTDPQLDLVIENLTLQGKNLFPNIVALEAHNFVQFSPYSTIEDQHSHDFHFTFAHIQADMRDVAFYYNKKSGLPKLKDSGVADVFLGGGGLTVKVHLRDAGKDRTSVFHVKDVHVKIDSLKFSIRDSNHDLLYKTLKPLATGLIKKQISKAIQNAVRTGLEYVDGQLVQVRDRMQEAKVSDETTRAQALKDLFQRKSTDAQSKASHKNSSFKVVAKRDSILLPDQGHPSGWIHKQGEREDLAKQGDGWRSPAFSIVSGGSTRSSTEGTRTAASTAGRSTIETMQQDASATTHGTSNGPAVPAH